jgi:G patch domain-containing protein 1
VGIKILIKMGWRPGQGVGPRVAKKSGKKKDKRKEKDIDKPTIVDEDIDMESISTQKVYGCQLPTGFQKDENEDEDSTDPEIDADVLYAPEDVESPLCNPKENRFGLGYKGLERLSGPTGHVDLFGKQLKFGKVDGKNKKPDVHVTGEVCGYY